MNNFSSTLLYVFLLFFVLSFEGTAQQRSHLPYSIFGIGELAGQGLTRNMAMGKTGYALSSDKMLNNLNPASYNTIDSISFFFDVGLSGSFVKYSTSRESQKGRDINLQHVTLGFPLTRWWKGSVGIVPFSTVGYQIESEKSIEGTTDYFDVSIRGNGGISKFYWGNSFTPVKNLHLGFNLNYLFGSINHNETAYTNELSGSITHQEESYLNNISFDFGAQYRIYSSDRYEITIGGVYGYQLPLHFKKELTVISGSSEILSEETLYPEDFKFPMFYGGGISVKLHQRLLLTGDYAFYNWSETESDNSDYTYTNTHNFRFGIEYQPFASSVQMPYWQRITYRAGWYKEDGYVNIRGNTADDIGYTLGMNFPLPGNKSSINLALLRGTQGTIMNDFIEKDYTTIMLSFTLHDWWFIKSKYD